MLSAVGPALAMLAVAAAGLRQLSGNATVPAPSSDAEAVLSVNAYALPHRPGLVVPGSLSDTVASWQISGYTHLTFANDRHESLVASTREFVLVLSVLIALLTVVLCRRLRMGWLSGALAVALAGVPATAVLLRVEAAPAGLATFWLTLAGLAAVVAADRPGRRPREDRTLAQPGSRRWPLVAMAAVAAAIAVLTAGVSVLLLLGLLLGVVVTRQFGREWNRSAYVLVALGLTGALLLASWITVWGSNVAPSGLPSVGAAGVALALGGLVLAAACSSISWLRPLAIGAVPVLLAAAFPGPAQVYAVILALAIGAVLAAGLLDHLIRVRLPSAPLLVAAEILLVAVTVGVFVLPPPSVAATTPTPNAEVAAWIQAELGTDALVEVDSLSRAQLVRDGVDPARLTTGQSAGAGFVLTALDRGTDLPLLAAFGTGSETLGLRLVVSDPAAYAAALADDRAARVRFGSALANNANLTLAAPAAAALREGDVDARLMVGLAGASASARFTIAEFTGTTGDLDNDDNPLREVTLTEVAGVGSAQSDGSAIRELARYFQMQQAPYQPLAVLGAITKLTIRYAAPAPLGLLP